MAHRLRSRYIARSTLLAMSMALRVSLVVLYVYISEFSESTKGGFRERIRTIILLLERDRKCALFMYRD